MSLTREDRYDGQTLWLVGDKNGRDLLVLADTAADAQKSAECVFDPQDILVVRELTTCSGIVGICERFSEEVPR